MSVSSVFLLVVQFGMFETVLSALFDRYPFLRAKKICVTAVISVTEFLLGLLLVCNVSLRHVLFVHRISYWVAAYGLKLALTLTTLLSLTNTHTHTHTRLTAFCPRLPGWAGTRKVKPIWILLKQETLSGSGISWAQCKSAPRSWQITTPAPHHSGFYMTDALPATQPTASKHWRPNLLTPKKLYLQTGNFATK